MKTARSSETYVNFCQTIQRNIPGDSYVYSHRLQNVEVSQNLQIFQDEYQ
jgi:hypothetical protein